MSTRIETISSIHGSIMQVVLSISASVVKSFWQRSTNFHLHFATVVISTKIWHKISDLFHELYAFGRQATYARNFAGETGLSRSRRNHVLVFCFALISNSHHHAQSIWTSFSHTPLGEHMVRKTQDLPWWVFGHILLYQHSPWETPRHHNLEVKWVHRHYPATKTPTGQRSPERH